MILSYNIFGVYQIKIIAKDFLSLEFDLSQSIFLKKMDPNRLFQQFFGGQPSYNMFNQGNSYPSGNYNNFHPNQNPSGFGQQYQQYQNPFNANINVNTNYNVHNNYYNEAEDEYDQYPNHQQYQNRNTQQQQQQPKKTQEKFQKKTEEKEAKDPQILQAENNPNSGHYYKKLGNDHFTKGQYQEALKYYTKAIVRIRN